MNRSKSKSARFKSLRFKSSRLHRYTGISSLYSIDFELAQLMLCACQLTYKINNVNIENITIVSTYSIPTTISSQMVLIRSNQKLIVAFSGIETSNMDNIIDELIYYTDHYQNHTNLIVYGKFYERFNELLNGTLHALQDAKKQYPSDLIYLTGHSLGGAITTLLAVYLMEHEPLLVPTLVYTFGCPRVGNLDFAKYCDTLLGDRLYRFMNQTDFIPDLPPQNWGFNHSGILVICTSEHEYTIKTRMEENDNDEITRMNHFILNRIHSHVTYLGKCMSEK